MYSVGEFAKLINKSVKTLQRWDYQKILTAHRSPKNRRYYSEEQLLEYKGIKASANSKNIAYFRVSGSSGLVINPSVLVKTDWYSTQYDISTLLIFNEKYWGGVSYRVQDAVALIFGMQFKDFRFGYSYDITTSEMSTAGSSGSHELMIGAKFSSLSQDNSNTAY